MARKLLSLVIPLMIVGLSLTPMTASAASFYEGKTIRIIVGLSAGGGYDLYARAIARHMGKYIPGNPAIIVENMPGAGSLVSANYLYKVAKPDGLNIGHFGGSLFINQMMGQPGIEFDAMKFELMGAAVTEEIAYAFTKASGITSVEKWMASKTPVKIGGQGVGTPNDNSVRIVRAALGLPIQLVSGYKGSADIRLAIESGELQGGAWGWYSMRATWRKALEAGDVVVVMQGAPKPFPDLPKVPLAISLAKTDEARELIEVGIHSPAIFTRPFVLPPGTPKDRVQILSKALQETLRDKEFIAETEKAHLDLNPVTGEELREAVAKFFKINPVLSAKLKDILFK